jgi:CBS domain-containing protein
MNFTPKREEPPSLDPRTIYEKIEKYMRKDIITLRPDQSIDEAIDILLVYNLTSTVVVDEEGRVKGMLSEKDCLRIMIDSAYDNFPYRDHTVKDYMSDEIRSVTPDQTVADVAYEFLNSSFRRFPVMKDGKLVGVISRQDVLRASRDITKTTWDLKR